MQTSPSSSTKKNATHARLEFCHQPLADPPYCADVYLKVKGGIRHMVNRYDKPNADKALRDAATRGFFSARPYRLGQACDGSITASVLALFMSFCEGRALDPVRVYAEAYPDEEMPGALEFEEIRDFADWQGVAYPVAWDAAAEAGLLESLTAANLHRLVDVVEALISPDG